MQVGVITNPHSRKNQAQRGRQRALTNLVGRDGLVRSTASLAEVAPVIDEFIDRGVQYCVSDGGDGTFHWMLNEACAALHRRGLGTAALPQLVPTNGGTIDFVARKAGIHGHADQIIDNLVQSVRAGAAPRTVQLDTLEVRGHRPGDPPDEWAFRKLGFATAIGGIGQRFFAKYYAEPEQSPLAILRVIAKTVGGYWGTLPLLRALPVVPEPLREYGREMLSGTPARVRADGRDYPYGRFMGLHAGAIDVDFGTVKLFRYAATPGRLHIVVGAMSALEATFRWVSLLSGSPIRSRRWHEFPGQALDVEATGDERLDPVIDGELFNGFDRVSVRLGPPVRVPAILSRRRG